MGKKITIQGKVHNVGYRLFLLEQADFMFIPNFDARNLIIDGKEALAVLVDGDDTQLDEFIGFVNSNFPENAVVESIAVEDYTGRIRDIDKFRQSFDTTQLSKIVQTGLLLLKKQDEMLEHTKYIPEIKEHTKYIPEIRENTKHIPEIKEHTKYIPEIKETIKDIKEDTKHIPEIKETIKDIREDTKEIKMNSYKTNQLLEEKFTKLENEITHIKAALAKAGIEV